MVFCGVVSSVFESRLSSVRNNALRPDEFCIFCVCVFGCCTRCGHSQREPGIIDTVAAADAAVAAAADDNDDAVLTTTERITDDDNDDNTVRLVCTCVPFVYVRQSQGAVYSIIYYFGLIKYSRS